MSLNIDEGDDFKGGLGKGLIIGGLGLAGIYGANMLKNFLLKKLYLEPLVYPKDHTFSFNVKQSSCKESLYKTTNDDLKKEASIYAQYALGAGVPLGALATYKALNYLGDVIHSLELKSKIRETEMAFNAKEKARAKRIRDNEEKALYGQDDSYGQNDLAMSIDNSLKLNKESRLKESNYKRMMEDPEIDKFININVYAFNSSSTDTIKEAGIDDVVQFLTTDMLTKYLPITYGALSSLGAIAGYNYMKNTFKKPKEDVLNVPEIRYVLNDRSDINSIDELSGLTVNKPIEKASGLMSYITDSASDSMMQTIRNNPQYLLGAAGVAALATVPAMLYNRSQTVAVEDKLDQILEQQSQPDIVQQQPSIAQQPKIIYISPESAKALKRNNESVLKKKAEGNPMSNAVSSFAKAYFETPEATPENNGNAIERYLTNKLSDVGEKQLKKYTPHIIGALGAAALPGIGMGMYNSSSINNLTKQVNDIRGSIKPPVQKSVANAFKMPTQKY